MLSEEIGGAKNPREGRQWVAAGEGENKGYYLVKYLNSYIYEIGCAQIMVVRPGPKVGVGWGSSYERKANDF